MTSRSRLLSIAIIASGAALGLAVALPWAVERVRESAWIRQLESQDAAEREEAAMLLGGMKSRRAVRPLVELLKREWRSPAAVAALGQIGQPAVQEILAVFDDTVDEETLLAAARCPRRNGIGWRADAHRIARCSVGARSAGGVFGIAAGTAEAPGVLVARACVASRERAKGRPDVYRRAPVRVSFGSGPCTKGCGPAGVPGGRERAVAGGDGASVGGFGLMGVGSPCGLAGRAAGVAS